MIYKTTDKTSPTALIGVTEAAIGEIGRMVASMEFPEREGYVQSGMCIIERECSPFKNAPFVVIGWARETGSDTRYFFYDGHYDLSLIDAWARFKQRVEQNMPIEDLIDV